MAKRTLVLVYLASQATSWCHLVAAVYHVGVIVCRYLVGLIKVLIFILTHHFNVLYLLQVLWVSVRSSSQRILASRFRSCHRLFSWLCNCTSSLSILVSFTLSLEVWWIFCNFVFAFLGSFLFLHFFFFISCFFRFLKQPICSSSRAYLYAIEVLLISTFKASSCIEEHICARSD